MECFTVLYLLTVVEPPSVEQLLECFTVALFALAGVAFSVKRK